MLNKGLVVIYPRGRGWGFSGITWFSVGRSGVANIVWRGSWILTAINITEPYEGSGKFYRDYQNPPISPPPPTLAVYYKSSILSPEQDDSNASRDWLDIFNFVIVCSEFFFSSTVTNIEFERKIRISEKTLERGMLRCEGYHVVT